MESFWLCDDCLFAAAYEDYSMLSLYYTTDEIEERIAAMQRGLVRLMPISADFDPEAGWGIKAFPIALRRLWFTPTRSTPPIHSAINSAPFANTRDSISTLGTPLPSGVYP